ncbi:FAD-binding protein [Alsobacter metallidurans]|uniref:FAD-binding protein n=1 Tax=Alsobacter metallidurans TaxID=340221 RepID=A0A917I5N6_9HYPH|nr:FAD-binding oxidoreductase [Alsobacter metallidurans]GGH13850.1 FAD-binding protein [Alsobacter metallidurans]
MADRAMISFSRRGIVLGATAAALARPALATKAPAFVLNDASGLNPTSVAKTWAPSAAETPGRLRDLLRAELRDAAAAGRPFTVGAARHSMGGQSLAAGGTAASLPAVELDLDTARLRYRVSAGARWRDVIARLDRAGFSPAVMQSNHDFGVAATFSVNAHGWPAPFAPHGSTVEAVTLMLADGTVLRCSRTENQELFRHAMGGYGLLGVILDLELAMVPNEALQPRFTTTSFDKLATAFMAGVSDPKTRMIYGRLSVDRAHFLKQALLVALATTPTSPHRLDDATPGRRLPPSLTRAVYRAQVGSDWGKRARWFAETALGPALASGLYARNALLNEPVSALRNTTRGRTDILHEYFVPPAHLAAFLDGCGRIIPAGGGDLLNVTLRYVRADRDSVLAYAPEERIAAVMSFSQQLTADAEAGMQSMTTGLIDLALSHGGSFYLPYRLHASRRQVLAAYPALPAFIETKRRHDPKALFRNMMWDRYCAA